MTAAAGTLLLAFNVSANAFDGSAPPASDSTQLLTIATPCPRWRSLIGWQLIQADLASRRIGIPRSKPEREVTIDTPLVDATVQNTPGLQAISIPQASRVFEDVCLVWWILQAA